MYRWENECKFYESTSGVGSACGDNDTIFDYDRLPAVLKYQRTEYAKQIRKDYESGRIKERRCNLREYTLRTDGCTNTVTTVQKDNYVAIGCAMRGRYNSDNKTEQKIEMNNEEICNSITTVQKDSMVVENFYKPPTN